MEYLKKYYSDCRFLISFSGKYLACESSLLSPEFRSGEGNDHEFEYQFYKIHISQTQPDLFGPAFIEVGIWMNFLALFFFVKIILLVSFYSGKFLDEHPVEKIRIKNDNAKINKERCS